MNKHQIWMDDRLSREGLAKSFTKIIQSSTSMSDDALVIGLHAEYGMGKSFFLQRWREQLKADGYTTVSFDSWENDYCGDPMVSFSAEVRDQLFSFIKGEKFNQTLGRVAMTSFDQVPMLQNFISSELELEDKVRIGKFGKSLIQTYKNTKEGVLDFKVELGKIYERVKKKNQNLKPIVIFIDELDRCRPNFAIELLEKIKHIFSVKGYVFVLGFDKHQLSKSIETIYGANMDTEGYLKRFFNIELNLPDPKIDKFVAYLVDDKFKFPTKVNLLGGTQHASSAIISNSLLLVAQKFQLRLRDLERLAQQSRVLLGAITEGETISRPYIPSVFIVLVALKAKHPEIYDRIARSIRDGAELMRQIEGIQGGSFEQSETFIAWRANLLIAFDAVILSEESIRDKVRRLDSSSGSDIIRHINGVRELRHGLMASGLELEESNQGMRHIKSLVDATYIDDAVN